MAGKRHHYVPEFLLRRFAEPQTASGWLYQMALPGGQIRKTRPGNAAVFGELYSFEADEGKNREAEDVLAQIESASAPIIARLAGGDMALSVEERVSLSLFIATLKLRTPLALDWSRQMEEGAANEMIKLSLAMEGSLDATLKASGEWINAADAERKRLQLLDKMERGELAMVSPHGRQVVRSIGQALDLIPQVAQMTWVVLRAPHEDRLIVGDTPVTHYDPTPHVPFGGHALLSSKNAETVIALDPAVALALLPNEEAFKLHDDSFQADDPLVYEAEAHRRTAHGQGHGPLTGEEIDHQRVFELNLRAYAHAQDWVYARTQADLADLRHEAKRRRGLVASLRPRPPGLTFLGDMADRPGSMKALASVRPTQRRSGNRR